MQSHLLGRKSEDLACSHLEANGWSILARNYRAGHKEIDIIARSANTIAFVEVKARAGTERGHPLQAVTWAKQREIAHAARAWLREHGARQLEYRFDAIAIIWNGSSHTLEHVQDAWTIQRW